MNRKFWYLTKMSLKKKVATKWFAVVNILLAVAIIAIVNIDTVITSLGGDFASKTEILVIDETDKVYDDFKTNFDYNITLLGQEDYFEIKETKEELETLKENVTDNSQIIIVIKEDETNYLSANIITRDELGTVDSQLLNQALITTKNNYAIVESGIDQELLASISNPIVVETTILNENMSAGEQMDIVMSTIFPIIILPFFMLSVFIVQMIGAEVNEEKTTKSMEVILTNVSAKTHFFSKILAVNTFVIIQGTLLIVYSGLGILVRMNTSTSGVTDQAIDLVGNFTSVLTESGIMENLVIFIPIILIFMLLSFVAYSLIAGVLAAMTTNMEDYQQIQMPILIIMLIGYYLSILSGLFEGALFIRVLSYVPLISTLLSPSLLMVGQITIVDTLISIGLLGLFIYILIKRGLKVYKIGVLNYSNEKIWTRFMKAVKSKDV